MKRPDKEPDGGCLGSKRPARRSAGVDRACSRDPLHPADRSHNAKGSEKPGGDEQRGAGTASFVEGKATLIKEPASNRRAGISDPRQLTPRQRQILEFINRYAAERGFPPTVREIQDAVGLQSTSSVHAQLKNLEQAGHITREPSRPRALGLTTPPTKLRRGSTDVDSYGKSPDSQHEYSSVVKVPLVGRIAAGQLAHAFEVEEDAVPIPVGLFSQLPAADLESGSVFFLRVSGDSMVGAGIHDGDLVLVRRQPTARPGEIVVAVVGGETTVKRLRISKSKIVLEAENPFYSPIEVHPEEVEIAGRVVGLIRPAVS